MGVVVRSIINGLVLAMLVTLAILCTTTYMLFTIGARAVEETRQLSRSRGVEIGVALAQMAGEKFDQSAAMKLSAVMERLVRISKQLNEDFIVEEMFLIGASGELLAHNDVALLARDAKHDYGGEQYSRALLLPKREPFRVEAIEQKDFQGIPLYNVVQALLPGAGHSLARKFPEKITTRQHISVAVFPVDQELPAGAVHVLVTVNSVNEYVTALRKYSLNTLAMTAGFVFLIAFLMVLLMSLSFRDAADGRSRAGTAKRRGRRARRAAPVILEQPGDRGPGPAAPVRRAVGRRRPVLPDPVNPGFMNQARNDPAAERPADFGYREAADDDFSDELPDYADSRSERDIFGDEYADQDLQPADGPPPHSYFTENPYRPEGRVMDAIPLDYIQRAGGDNSTLPNRKRSRL